MWLEIIAIDCPYKLSAISAKMNKFYDSHVREENPSGNSVIKLIIKQSLLNTGDEYYFNINSLIILSILIRSSSVKLDPEGKHNPLEKQSAETPFK